MRTATRLIVLAAGLLGTVPAVAQEVPERPMFTDIDLLLAIITAQVQRIDVEDAGVRGDRFPGWEWIDFDRDLDEGFDLSDVDLAIVQFNHDRFDLDRDGVNGYVELECWRGQAGIRLDPDRSQSQPGIRDGDVDCDGDRMPNWMELEFGMNPLDNADADLDFDGDGLSNWTELDNGLDPNNPADAELDSDGDGLTDGEELLNRLDRFNPDDAVLDFDGDGITNLDEIQNGLDPRDPDDVAGDPDNDGTSSGNEIARNRHPRVADCDGDPVEFGGRNDRQDAATVLPAGLRVRSDRGNICHPPGREDEDWYRFTVVEDDTRVVVANEFRGVPVNLEMDVYGSDGGILGSSRTPLNVELVNFYKGHLRPGDYYVRVYARDGGATPYNLTVTQIPEAGDCAPDYREGEAGNDEVDGAAFLGLEDQRIGDVWVCESERRDGDWFELLVGGGDKTVHLTYTRLNDGNLGLAGFAPARPAYGESVQNGASSQCLNIRGGVGLITQVFVQVFADFFVSDGDDRIDYVITVVNVDLDDDPRGACDILNGGLYEAVEWPTLEL